MQEVKDIEWNEGFFFRIGIKINEFHRGGVEGAIGKYCRLTEV